MAYSNILEFHWHFCLAKKVIFHLVKYSYMSLKDSSLKSLDNFWQNIVWQREQLFIPVTHKLGPVPAFSWCGMVLCNSTHFRALYCIMAVHFFKCTCACTHTHTHTHTQLFLILVPGNNHTLFHRNTLGAVSQYQLLSSLLPPSYFVSRTLNFLLQSDYPFSWHGYAALV